MKPDVAASTKTISVSQTLMLSIMPSTPTKVTTDVIDWVMRLLQGAGDVVDVVGDAAQDLAVRVRVKKAQGQPGEFLVDLRPQIDRRCAGRRPP